MPSGAISPSRMACVFSLRASAMLSSSLVSVMNGPSGLSFDHLVGAEQERLRHGEAEGLGGLEVDRKLELDRLLDGEVGRLGALQDAVDITSRAAEQIDPVDAIGDQTAVGGEGPDRIERRHVKLRG